MIRKTIKIITVAGVLIGHIVYSAGLDFDPGDDQGPAFPLMTVSIVAESFSQYKLPQLLAQKVEKELPVDICIISNDKPSQDWLNNNNTKNILSMMHEDGYCLAINLTTWEDLWAIKKQFTKIGIKIPVIPMKADWVYRQYGITNYPGVLTPSSGVYMQRFNQ